MQPDGTAAARFDRDTPDEPFDLADLFERGAEEAMRRDAEREWMRQADDD